MSTRNYRQLAKAVGHLTEGLKQVGDSYASDSTRQIDGLSPKDALEFTLLERHYDHILEQTGDVHSTYAFRAAVESMRSLIDGSQRSPLPPEKMIPRIMPHVLGSASNLRLHLTNRAYFDSVAFTE